MEEKSKQGNEQKVRYLVRIQQTDLDGNKQTLHALTKVKGIDFMFAHAVCVAAKINPTHKLGLLSESDVKKLNDVIQHPQTFNIPSWILNRRSDIETGDDIHILTSNLDFIKSNDIKFLQKLKCYRGVRHGQRLPVRGQRTKSNFRRNKGRTTGVSKSKNKK
ncbi:MAG: 30S ribosomal protein S13 [Candidatus Woesearchaeota archaeon]